MGTREDGMTPAEKFGRWLAGAMRHAGLDIDKQRGGGRAELAERLNVSRSTISRWLDGSSLPGSEYFEALAEALDVYAIDMLVDGGIVSKARAIHPAGAPRIYDSGTEIPAHIDTAKFAALLGYTPEEQDIFVAVVETTMVSLRERRLRALGLPLDAPAAGRRPAE